MFSKLCRITMEPKLAYTTGANPTAVVNLNMAYNFGRKGEDGKRPTQFIEASLWGKQAEALHPHLEKGMAVSVSIDDLHVETYPKKDGGEGHKLTGRIVAFDFGGGKKESGGDQAPVEKPAAKNDDSFDSDIPF